MPVLTSSLPSDFAIDAKCDARTFAMPWRAFLISSRILASLFRSMMISQAISSPIEPNKGFFHSGSTAMRESIEYNQLSRQSRVHFYKLADMRAGALAACSAEQGMIRAFRLLMIRQLPARVVRFYWARLDCTNRDRRTLAVEVEVETDDGKVSVSCEVHSGTARRFTAARSPLVAVAAEWVAQGFVESHREQIAALVESGRST